MGVKSISYINQNEIEAGDAEFDYAKMSDDDAEGAREGLIQEKGFFMLPNELFCNVCANAKAGGSTVFQPSGRL